MSQQLVIPQDAKCARCGLESKTPEQVYTSFGVRMMDGKLVTQSHCKKCRKQKLSKEVREKFAKYKETAKQSEAELVGKLKEEFDAKYIAVRDEKNKILEKLSGEFKNRRSKISDQVKEQIEKKRQELMNS